jgi:hypothetical protein
MCKARLGARDASRKPPPQRIVRLRHEQNERFQVISTCRESAQFGDIIAIVRYLHGSVINIRQVTRSKALKFILTEKLTKSMPSAGARRYRQKPHFCWKLQHTSNIVI